jgi:hypothetical protein
VTIRVQGSTPWKVCNRSCIHERKVLMACCNRSHVQIDLFIFSFPFFAFYTLYSPFISAVSSSYSAACLTSLPSTPSLQYSNVPLKMTTTNKVENNDHLVQSNDPDHPANLIPQLCAAFYTLGWVSPLPAYCPPPNIISGNRHRRRHVHQSRPTYLHRPFRSTKGTH